MKKPNFSHLYLSRYVVEALSESRNLPGGYWIHWSYINCFSTRNSNPLPKNSGLLCDSVKTDNNMLFCMFFGLKWHLFMSKSKFLDICNVVFDAAQDGTSFNSSNPLWLGHIYYFRSTSGCFLRAFLFLSYPWPAANFRWQIWNQREKLL